MSRAISLDDVVVLAQGLVWIANASARVVWDGTRRHVRLAVSMDDAANVPVGKILSRWEDYLRRRKGFAMPIRVVVCDRLPFFFNVRVFVPKAQVERLAKAVTRVLTTTFAYPNWPPERGLAADHFVALLQDVEGVRGVELLRLYLNSKDEAPRDIHLPHRMDRGYVLFLDAEDLVVEAKPGRSPDEAVLCVGTGGGACA